MEPRRSISNHSLGRKNLKMKKNCIVCVDDDIDVLNNLKQQLKRLYQDKYLLEFADNPKEAIEIIKDLVSEKYPIPVIISDYRMPGMSGDEFFGTIQGISEMANKILLSGQADIKGIINSVNNSNLYAFISKPWEEENLFLTINAAIEKYTQEQFIKISNEKLKETNEKVRLLNHKLKIKNAIFSKFVPHRIMESVLNKNEDQMVTLGECVKKQINVLFCDIRNSTYISEKLGIEDCFNFLNEYHHLASTIVMKQDGIIDNFMGDGVLALFKDSKKALKTALEIKKNIGHLQHWTDKLSLNKLDVGIGISYGEVMVGTIGTEDRMQTTVIGDTVNTASRLQELSKKYDYSAIVSEFVLNNLENDDDSPKFSFDHIKDITIRGKESKVRIFGLKLNS